MSLTPDEWMEVYYAVWSKRQLVAKGTYDEFPGDPERDRWVGVLDTVLEKLGPDATNMWSHDKLSSAGDGAG